MQMLIDGVTQVCCVSTCAIVFAVPKDWDNKKRRDHTTFYCPNGHGQNYTGASEAEKLRRERDRLAQQIAQRDDEIAREQNLRLAAERQASAARGQMTRIKNRVGRGVCPCCQRTFSNLAAHMKTQHQDYTVAAE